MGKSICFTLSLFIFVCLSHLILADSCKADILSVPSEYSTIQAAIDAAAAEDIVLVANGTYTGAGNKNLDFHGKAITVQSQNGPNHTVIDCQDDGRGIFFHGGEGPSSIFRGFTIRNGYVDGSSFFGGKGGGIYCYNSSPTIENCTVSYCRSDGFGGGGITLNNSSATIKDTIIERNTTVTCGGGLYIFDSASPTITNSIIRYNKTTGYSSGGGICVIRSNPNFNRCTISYNESDLSYSGVPGQETTNSGGISYREGSAGKLESSIIAHNKAQERGGIGSWQAAPTITNCLIEGNEATVDGGGGIGLYQNSDAKISQCTIKNNSAREYGGGVSVWNQTASSTGPEFTDTIVENNTAGDSGGGLNILDSSFELLRSIVRDNTSAKRAGIGFKAINGTTSSVLVNNLIYNNTASEFGGGVTFFGAAHGTVTNCTIVNNTSASGSAWGYAYSGGVYLYQAQVDIANTILWGNQPLDSLVTGATITYSDVSGGYSGQGNINSNPSFVSTTDYHLNSASPCRNFANNGANHTPSLDLGKNSRNDGAVDMGAWEYPFVSGGPGVSGKIGADLQRTDLVPAPGIVRSNVATLLLLLLNKNN